MSKIGRNESCPCGSGKKYKNCCLPLQQDGRIPSPMAQLKVSLLAEIKKIQEDAAAGKSALRELGVFIFFSQENGDAWVFEASDNDAVQVAEKGTALNPPVEENSETIEVNWSHTFALRDHDLFVTGYASEKETALADAPTQQISAAMRRIMNRYSKALLNRVHVRSDDDANA
jgi:hypothetical protein